ncbi:DUF6310 domain-containing protein [Pyxidicoccus sp. MSG2]|uniref:DUF6310 domain-containing protein n=1 Tax=Pyxidicoccus sp. MSG2 TaxID=2996790 RepID=UPI00226E8AED|nr:DUF6310 domain-containing protein [Pyxidicoccus sp. MSG2]MCY1017147.1 DUF6310 domain-containing protein [Pyxidicoccus sp. MSG2]
MRFLSCIVLLFLFSACATTEPGPKAPVARSPRLANLQRAATLPWADDGQCVVHEASNEWPVLVERCFHALDHDKVRFRDPTGRCAVASAGAAAMGLGVCILVAPEIVVGAVIITSAVVVAVVIKEELDEYARRRRASPEAEASREPARPRPETKPATQDPVTEPRPGPEGSPSGQDWFPPAPPESAEQDRRPECAPRPVPHLGGDALHNTCADRVPQNDARGFDVLVNGKRFDALQLRARVLWEVKTDNFDTYPPELQEIVIAKQVKELRRERDLARACGFNFWVGVRSAEHRAALRDADRSLDIVVMDWC